MSQHNFDITTADANTGITVRAAINLALKALASSNSGTTEPSTPYAYQLWADTSTGYLKIRNSSNTAWVSLLKMSDGVPTNSNLATLAALSSLLNISTLSGYASMSNLTALVGITGAPDKVPYFTGMGSMAIADLSSLGRSLLAATTQAGMQLIIGAAGGMSIRQTVLDSFRDVQGRADFLWSGTVDFATLRDTGDAISESYNASQYPYLAFDGNNTTYWQSATAIAGTSGVAYLGMKNLKRNIKSMKYLNNAANDSLTSIKIQYSTDLITWLDIQTTTVVNTASTWNEFAVTAYAGGDAGLHAIRLLANSNPSGGGWTIQTLILQYDNILDVCTTGNAVKYDENGSYPATNAFNNAWADYYQSSANMNTGNLYLGQSGLTSAVKAIILKQGDSAGAKEVRLSWKQNVGDAWIDLATVALVCAAATPVQSINVPSYSPSGSHYFAVRPTTNCGAYYWNIYEMEFYTSIGDLNLTASATDKLHTTFAAGYGSGGAVDYVGEAAAPASAILTSPAVGKTHFIYQNRDNAGALTYGSSPIVPQYGQTFDASKHELLHFDGSNASTVITSEYGINSWVVVGNGALSTTSPKFGTAKIAGTTGLCKNTTIQWNNGQPFTLEAWWQASGFAGNQCLFGGAGAYSPQVYVNSSKQFLLSLSSNNSSFDICSALTSSAQTLNNSTWYKMIFEWDGLYYRVWHGTQTSDMVCVLCAKSSTAIYSAAAYGVELGGFNGGSNPLQGAVDEFRLTIGSNRYGWSPVAEVAAFGKYDSDIHFYDTNLHKMYYGGGATWTEAQRVFLGEGYMDAQGFTSATNYALQGKYESAGNTIVSGGATTKNHNIGVVPKVQQTVANCKYSDNGYMPGDEIQISSAGGASTSYEWCISQTRKTMTLSTINTPLVPTKSGAGNINLSTNWTTTFRSSRGW